MVYSFKFQILDIRKDLLMEKGLSGIYWKRLPRKMPKTEQFSCSNKETPRETQRADTGGTATKTKITQAIVRQIFPETAR